MRHYPSPELGTGIIYEDYTAGKTDVFVCIVVGVEPKDGSGRLDVEAQLQEMGWQMRADLDVDR